MKVPPSLAFFVPAHNEADNLEGVVARIHEYCDVAGITERTVIIVDDGSTDHTNQVVEDLRFKYGFTVVKHVVNRGYGAALRSGLKAALATGHDWIAFCDSDHQFDPMDTLRLFGAINTHDADVAIGYRERRADGFGRRATGRCWHLLSKTLLGYEARDVDCGFKLFSRQSIEAVESVLIGEHATISPEILMRLQRRGYKIVETGMPHYPRDFGEQSGVKFKVMWQSFTGLLHVYSLSRKENTHVRHINRGHRAA